MISRMEAQPLDEHTWLSCREPQAMLGFLRNSEKPSERKLRLFGCACVRRIWDSLTDGRCREAVEVSERYADGNASREELEAAFDAADRVHQEARRQAFTLTIEVLDAARLAAHPVERGLADSTALAAAHGVAWHGGAAEFRARVGAEQNHQCSLLRDLFGPQSFRPVSLPVACRTPTVLALARRAYEERHLPAGTLDAALLAVLADAVAEAGCNDEEVLAHLRQQGGVHVRGCWALDLLTGRA